jgi:hypothetical protein
MLKQLSSHRRELIAKLESFIGNECYNSRMRNYGPGGVRKSDGRAFRYPISFRLQDGTKKKVKDYFIPKGISANSLRTGHYSFGANQLDIVAALERVLTYLEKHHGLIVEAQSKDQTP